MIRIFDTTLRDGEQSPGCSMNLQEKLQMARQLERMKVDVIEAGFAISSQGDFESVHEIAKAIKGCQIASLSRALEKDIDAAWEAVRVAENPLIHTFLASSDIHLKYKLKMTREQALERAAAAVKYAKKYCNEVEFSAEDASRSDIDFLIQMFEAVIAAGATIVNIPDTVGYTDPFEYYEMIKAIKERTKGIEKVHISVHCHNDLGMAVANSMAAIRAGATQVECTVNGIGERAGNAAMEEVVMALKTRKDIYGQETGIVTTEIMRASHLLQSLTGVKVQPHKAIVGANAFAHEAGIHQHGVLMEKTTYEIMTPESVGLSDNLMVLGKHSGKHALKDRLEQLGYFVSEEEMQSLFERFKNLADEKKTVYDQDLEALVIGDMANVVEGVELVDYSTATSEGKDSKTIIKVKSKDGAETEIVGSGKGPIDAAFDALSAIFGQDLKLEDFSIYSVTRGKDALGETKLVLSKNGHKFSGKGVSNDIIKSSILAYINAVNHLEYFTERQQKLEEE
ncbi:MAG: 2-isopropylmalate synthase [Tissierellia bacterium]|nr:2-isopropylmalate synthase [Tissierellia bacterium]